MSITIIVKDGKPKGRTRTTMDKDLKHAWGTTSFRNAEDADKARFLERKIKKEHNSDTSRVTAKMISNVK